MGESLFVLNPKIESYSKRYIWGTDKEAFSILAELANHRIRVDGFISDHKDEIGMMLINKPVISLDMLEDKADIVIIANKEYKSALSEWGGMQGTSALLDMSDMPNVEIITGIYTFHELFTANKVIVYGAGEVGQAMVSVLSAEGVDVDFFLDKDKSGQKLLDIPIYHPHKLRELEDDAVIIEAGRFWQEMEDAVKKNNPRIETFYVDMLPEKKMSMYIRLTDNKLCPMWRLHYFYEAYPECFHDRKSIILGNDLELSMSYKEVFECFGVKRVSIMVTDEAISCETAPMLDEILYEENYLLLLCDYEKASDCRRIIEKIEDLGISDADWTSLGVVFPIKHREFIVDLNLDYTFKMNYAPGLFLHGNEKVCDVKIVTLGGSTTDEEFCLIPSWPKILYEKYCKENIALYNGGIEGYKSLEELIKLVRDILYLKPDIIVVYDGFNDANNEAHTNCRFLYKMLEYYKEEIYEYGAYPHHKRGSKDIFRGIKKSNEVIEHWLKNIESMYAIASIQNIKFFSFIQPMPFSQKTHTKHGMALQKMCNIFVNQEYLKNQKLFREHGNIIEKSHPYIHDLSHIFDEKDVYMDNYCHVCESGNEIVADSIWKIIEPSVKEILERKTNTK